MEEARIPRDLVQRGHHELGIGKGLVVKVDLDLQEFPGQAEVVILDRVFQRRNVLLYGRDFFEELCEFLSFASERVIELGLGPLPTLLVSESFQPQVGHFFVALEIARTEVVEHAR